MTWFIGPDEYAGIGGLDLDALGIPTIDDFVARYEGLIRPSGRLALQLPCFEMGALSDRLVSSTPERPCDDVCGLDPISSESDGDAADFLD
jgi:hypothetical protein